jgi:hypothetical protein
MRYLTYLDNGEPIAIFNFIPVNKQYICLDDSFKDYEINSMIVDLTTLKLVPKQMIDNPSLDRLQKENEVKIKRSILLQQTDWTQLEDIPENIKLPHKTYRQELRDLPLQEGFPDNIVWPVLK